MTQAQAQSPSRPKVYIRSASEAPEGVSVHRGPRGGLFYYLDEASGRAGGESVSARGISVSEAVERWRDTSFLPPDRDVPLSFFEHSQRLTRLAGDLEQGWAYNNPVHVTAWQMAASAIFNIPYEGSTDTEEYWSSLDYSYAATVLMGRLYYDTQKRLAEAQVQSLPLFRGVAWRLSEVPDKLFAKIESSPPLFSSVEKVDRNNEYHHYYFELDDFYESSQPISSWTSSLSTAEFFSHPHLGPNRKSVSSAEVVYTNEYLQDLLEVIRENYPDETRSPEDLENFIEESGGWEAFNHLLSPPVAYEPLVSAVYVSDIPAKDLLALPDSGPTMSSEDEYMVVGRKIPAKVYIRVSQLVSRGNPLKGGSLSWFSPLEIDEKKSQEL
jgi:hypothetical protein